MRPFPLHSANRDRGATAIEYALMIALVGAIVFASVTLLGGRLSGVFTKTASSVVAGGTGGATTSPTAPTFTSFSASSSGGETRLTWAVGNGGSPITNTVVYIANDNSNSCSGVIPSTPNGGPYVSPYNTGEDNDNCWRVAVTNAIGTTFSSVIYHNP